MYLQIFVYPFLFVFLGGFFLVYLGTLMNTPRPINMNSILRYGAAVMFFVIFIGAIASWLLDCKFTYDIPTFGLEDRPHVIG
jgi:hypothetical protein